MRKTQSVNELNNKKKKKKKIKEISISTSTNNISNPSSTVVQINQSYSDVDCLPMMPIALFQSSNQQIPVKINFYSLIFIYIIFVYYLNRFYI